MSYINKEAAIDLIESMIADKGVAFNPHKLAMALKDMESVEIPEAKDTDLISRQAAIEAVEKAVIKDAAKSAIESLPPVNQKQITGKLKNPCDSLLTEDSEGVKEQKSKLDCISRADAINVRCAHCDTRDCCRDCSEVEILLSLPPVGDMGEVSDGYHTFNQLYYQRAVLFATIVNQNKDKAWKSWKHEDGQFCFNKGGEWFIVGVDTPEGSYTYHYEKKYWDLFNCEELGRGKHWDGHTEDDVTRLLSLPPVEPVAESTTTTDEVVDFNNMISGGGRIRNLPPVEPKQSELHNRDCGI